MNRISDEYLTKERDDAYKIYMEAEKELALSKYSFPKKPSADGFYHINIKDSTKKNGRTQKKAKTLEELKEKVYQYEKGIEGELPKTFKDVFEIVLSEKIRYVKDKEKKLSVSNTVNRMVGDYKRYIQGTFLEDILISNVTRDDLENICFLNLDRYSMKKKAFFALRGLLKSVIYLSYSRYWIHDDIYSRIDFNKFKYMICRDTPIEHRVHSDDELDAICNFIQAKHIVEPSYIPAYALELQILMGLRRGEVAALMWKDIVDNYILISRIQITVEKSDVNPKNYDAIVNHTKTWKDRKFPITEEIRSFLLCLRDVQKQYGLESDYLFPADTKNGIISNKTVYDLYRRICNKLTISVSREFTKGPHSFRRNAITKTINNSNGNETMAAQLFGNTPNVIRSNYYTGLDLEKAKRVLEGNQVIS